MKEKTPQILVIDDDTRLRSLLVKYLLDNKFEVLDAENTLKAREILSEVRPDIIIVDVMMPGENGIEFTKWIKANYERLPVLILTAKGDANDRISGLESGADDYMAKPFEPKELVLRLKNILQRAKIPHEAVDEIYTFGRYSFNIKDLRLKDRDVYIHITQGEAGSLKLLCQSVGKPVTRETMAAYFGDIDPRSIDVVMARLRRKIEIDTKNPIYLHTVRNEGYLLHTDQS